MKDWPMRLVPVSTIPAIRTNYRRRLAPTWLRGRRLATPSRDSTISHSPCARFSRRRCRIHIRIWRAFFHEQLTHGLCLWNWTVHAGRGRPRRVELPTAPGWSSANRKLSRRCTGPIISRRERYEALSARSSGLLSANLPLLPRRFQLPVALRVDLTLAPSEYVLRGDVARGAVQAGVIVVVNVSLHQTPRIIERQRCSRPDALPFERFVPALDLSVRLRVKRRDADVRHPRDPTELLEVLGDELRPVVRDDPGSRFRVLLLRPLQDDLDVRLSH